MRWPSSQPNFNSPFAARREVARKVVRGRKRQRRNEMIEVWNENVLEGVL